MRIFPIVFKKIKNKIKTKIIKFMQKRSLYKLALEVLGGEISSAVALAIALYFATSVAVLAAVTLPTEVDLALAANAEVYQGQINESRVLAATASSPVISAVQAFDPATGAYFNSSDIRVGKFLVVWGSFPTSTPTTVTIGNQAVPVGNVTVVKKTNSDITDQINVLIDKEYFVNKSTTGFYPLVVSSATGPTSKSSNTFYIRYGSNLGCPTNSTFAANTVFACFYNDSGTNHFVPNTAVTATLKDGLTSDGYMFKENWASGAPRTGSNNEKFSVKWSGDFTFEKGVPYVFTARADDGIRVTLDGAVVNFRNSAGQVANTFVNQSATTYVSDKYQFPKDSSSTHKVVVEYFESTGLAEASLRWDKVTNPATSSTTTIYPTTANISVNQNFTDFVITSITGDVAKLVTSAATFSSSNPSVALVVKDSNGRDTSTIRGISAGQAIITAEYGGQKVTATVTVTSATSTDISISKPGIGESLTQGADYFIQFVDPSTKVGDVYSVLLGKSGTTANLGTITQLTNNTISTNLQAYWKVGDYTDGSTKKIAEAGAGYVVKITKNGKTYSSPSFAISGLTNPGRPIGKVTVNLDAANPISDVTELHKGIVYKLTWTNQKSNTNIFLVNDKGVLVKIFGSNFIEAKHPGNWIDNADVPADRVTGYTFRVCSIETSGGYTASKLCSESEAVAVSKPLTITNAPVVSDCDQYLEFGWQACYTGNNKIFAQIESPQRLNSDKPETDDILAIDQNWGTGTPSTAFGVYDNFAGQWRTNWVFRGGLYEFYAGADDNFTVIVDGKVILSSGETTKQSFTDRQFTKILNLTEGKHKILVKFNEYSGLARIKFGWARATKNTTPNITIDPTSNNSPSVTVGSEFKQYTAWYDADGEGPVAKVNVTTLADWGIHDSTIAQVTGKGSVKGLKAGRTGVTAFYKGVGDTSAINVTSAPIANPSISVLTPTASSKFTVGDKVKVNFKINNAQLNEGDKLFVTLFDKNNTSQGTGDFTYSVTGNPRVCVQVLASGSVAAYADCSAELTIPNLANTGDNFKYQVAYSLKNGNKVASGESAKFTINARELFVFPPPDTQPATPGKGTLVEWVAGGFEPKNFNVRLYQNDQFLISLIPDGSSATSYCTKISSAPKLGYDCKFTWNVAANSVTGTGFNIRVTETSTNTSAKSANFDVKTVISNLDNIKYDFDNNGRFDYGDVRKFSEILVQSPVVCPANRLCDISGDGTISAFDGAKLSSYYLVKYDLNFDSYIDFNDWAIVNRAVAGVSNSCPADRSCDLNQDGKVTVSDLVLSGLSWSSILPANTNLTNAGQITTPSLNSKIKGYVRIEADVSGISGVRAVSFQLEKPGTGELLYFDNMALVSGTKYVVSLDTTKYSKGLYNLRVRSVVPSNALLSTSVVSAPIQVEIDNTVELVGGIVVSAPKSTDKIVQGQEIDVAWKMNNIAAPENSLLEVVLFDKNSQIVNGSQFTYKVSGSPRLCVVAVASGTVAPWTDCTTKFSISSTVASGDNYYIGVSYQAAAGQSKLWGYSGKFTISAAPKVFSFSNINLPNAKLGQKYEGSVDFTSCKDVTGTTRIDNLPAGLTWGGPAQLAAITGNSNDSKEICRIFILGIPTSAGTNTIKIVLNADSTTPSTKEFNIIVDKADVVKTFSVSGRILQNNGNPGLAQVSVDGKSTQTAADGSYSIKDIPTNGSGISINPDGKSVTAKLDVVLNLSGITKTWYVGAGIGSNTDLGVFTMPPLLTSSISLQKLNPASNASSNLVAPFTNSNQLYRISWVSVGADRCEFLNPNTAGSSNYIFIQSLLGKFIYQSSYQANNFKTGLYDFYIGPDGPSGYSMKSSTPSIVTLRCYKGGASQDTTASLTIQ